LLKSARASPRWDWTRASPSFSALLRRRTWSRPLSAPAPRWATKALTPPWPPLKWPISSRTFHRAFPVRLDFEALSSKLGFAGVSKVYALDGKTPPPPTPPPPPRGGG